MSNDPKNPNAANAAHAGYHSAHDARQMQAMARALLEGRRPIALSAASNATLEHYSRLLVRDLRQQENVRIVAHQPGSTEQLVQQVNALVADVRVDHVIDRGAAAGRPVHVFVVHDGPQLSNAEFTLLLRLVNDLPGANLRIVLVQDGDTDLTPSLHALGPQALHWNILPPGMTATQAARAEGSREALKEALKEAMRESPQRHAAPARHPRPHGCSASRHCPPGRSPARGHCGRQAGPPPRPRTRRRRRWRAVQLARRSARRPSHGAPTCRPQPPAAPTGHCSPAAWP